VRYLLDTCAWLWLQHEPSRFDPDVLELLQEPNNEICLSVASVWEIALKASAGNLRIPVPLEELSSFLASRLDEQRIAILAITMPHAVRAPLLPAHHKDIFDRIIIAQAEIESATIITNDTVFESYSVSVVRVRGSQRVDGNVRGR
jgi:PIN domain nuclease of toxin-antitoxin system